jgi:hypothetical protein
MLEIKIDERSATVTVQRDGFKIKETAAMMAHAYISAVLAMERGRSKEITIKIINGFMDGVDRALCETDSSFDKLNSFAKCGAGFESVFFGKFGDMNA